MEFLRITGLALCGAILGCAVSLLVAVALLELPYSLPFAGACRARRPLTAS